MLRQAWRTIVSGLNRTDAVVVAGLCGFAIATGLFAMANTVDWPGDGPTQAMQAYIWSRHPYIQTHGNWLPGFKYCAGLSMMVFGHPLLVPRLFNLTISTLTIAALYLIAHRLFGAATARLSAIDSLDANRFRASVVLAENGPLAESLRQRHPTTLQPLLRPLLRSAAGRRAIFLNAAACISATASLQKILMRERIDLIHAYSETTVKYAALLRWVSRRPTISTFLEANLPARRRFHRAGLAFAMNRGIDLIVTPSKSALDGLINSGVTPSKLTVVPHGVDVAAFGASEQLRDEARRRFGVGKDEFLVVMASRFTRMKGHDVMLKAIALLRDQGRRVCGLVAGKPLFPGESPWREEILRLRAALGLHTSVRLTGWVNDLPLLLAASDVVVHPCTLPDTLPLAVIEAMAAGRPVVASRIGGLTEMIKHDETGLLVEPGDDLALANAIGNLIDRPEKAARYGINARREAAKAFDENGYVLKIMNLYDRLLSQGHH